MNSQKPTIIIDIDGVILNFSKSFSDWWNNCYSSSYIISDNPHDWQFDHPDKNAIYRGIMIFYKADLDYPLIESEIPEYIQKLQEKYHIHLVTAFPEKYKESRIRNLSMYNIPYDEITFANGHKIDLVKEINPIALIEDSPKNITSFVQNGYQVYVPNFWNYTKSLNHNLITFYSNWKELSEMLLSIDN